MSQTATTRPGYRHLKIYQFLVITFDLTDIFCKVHLSGYEHLRTRSQMFQAARSSKQCLVEGYTQQGLKGYIKLTGVAHGSNEELREDYHDFLRQRKLSIWQKNHPQLQAKHWVAIACNDICNGLNPTYPTFPTDPEYAANFMLDLTINNSFLLAKLIDSIKEKHKREGGLTEKLYRDRKEYRGF